MRTPSRLVSCASALLLLGCPSGEPGGGAAKVDPATPPLPPHSEPGPAQPPAPVGPGPVGPAGPVLQDTPHPDDGRDQLELREKRPIRVGGVPVTAWIADTDPRRQLGLMHVRALPRDHGMLFVYPDVRPRTFWMKNTFIPLSIAFIDETGTIDSILDMQPHDLGHHPSKGAVRFGLEMTQGWFADHGVHVGDRVEGITELPGYH